MKASQTEDMTLFFRAKVGVQSWPKLYGHSNLKSNQELKHQFLFHSCYFLDEMFCSAIFKHYLAKTYVINCKKKGEERCNIAIRSLFT